MKNWEKTKKGLTQKYINLFWSKNMNPVIFKISIFSSKHKRLMYDYKIICLKYEKDL